MDDGTGTGNLMQMQPNVWHGIFNSEKSGVSGLTFEEQLYGKVWPKTTAELKNRDSYRYYNDAAAVYEDILNFDFEWSIDEEINDGLPHLRFVKTLAKFEETTATKRVDENGETIITVDFELSKEIEEEAEVLFAVFKDDKLIEIVQLPVPAGYQCGGMDLPYDADYIKIFVWNEMSGLSPLAKMGMAVIE